MVALIQVECLEAVVQAKSFRAAALALNMSQPAVSGHIVRLERELHLELLTRTTGGSELTPAGRRMLPHLRAFADSADSIQRASDYLRSNTRRTLTILTNSRTIRRVLPDVIGLLKESFGPMVVRIADEQDPDALMAEVRTGRADMAVLMRDEDETRAGAGLAETLLVDIGPVGICGRADSPVILAHAQSSMIEPAELDGEPLILLANGQRMALADRLFPPAQRSFVTIVDDTDVAIDLVDRGAGYAMVGVNTRIFREPQLAWRGLRGAPMTSMTMISHPDSVSPPAEAVIDFLTVWGRGIASTLRVDRETGLSFDGPNDDVADRRRRRLDGLSVTG